MTLTHEQVLRFHIEGYLVVEELVPERALPEAQALLDGLFDRWDELPRDLAFDLGDKKLHDGPQRTPQVNSASTFEPRLLETEAWHAAHAVARDLLGDTVTFRGDHSIYKPPRNEAATPWHQDMAYRCQRDMARGVIPNRKRASAHFWIPMQEATVASGCMWFIPRTHLGNLRMHHPMGNDPENHTLEPEDSRVPCPVPAGGCTVHTAKTMHYTGPNDTDAPRRAWILIFSLPD